MNAIKRLAVVLTILAGSLIIGNTPANAATCDSPTASSTTTVYVEDHTGSAWPVNCAQNYVDRYTHSNIVYGTCRSGHECARVYEKTISSNYAAYTCPAGWNCLGKVTSYTRIYVNPQRNGKSYGYRLRVITHELGHWRGIIKHNPYCTSLMYYRVTCSNGSLTPFSFTSGERSILSTH